MSRPEEPHSIDCEKSILGAVLLDDTCFHRLVDLRPDDFYLDAHRRIFAAMTALASTGNPVDLVSLTGELKQSADFERIGGSNYLGELVDFVPSASNVTYYLKGVLAKSRQRQLMSAARQILIDAGRSGADPDQLIADAFGQLQGIGQAGEQTWLSLEEQARQYEQYIQTADETRFATGFPNLDAIVRGVAPGEVMMVVGYSGTFKSAFLHNLLLNGAMNTRKKALFFSLEMPATLVYQRTVQIALEQLTYYIESGYAGKKDVENYRQRTLDELKRIGADNLIVSPKPALSIEQVEHYTRQARAEFGEIGVVGIDYLGLMAAEHTKSEYERISYCAEQSKNMAKRLNLPVVVLTQINRSSATTGEMETWSAKGSGAVEASADYMIGIQRDDNKDIIIKVMKNRNGEANLQLRADLDAKYLKFRSLEPHNAIAAKNVERGKARLRTAKGPAPVEYDPFR